MESHGSDLAGAGLPFEVQLNGGEAYTTIYTLVGSANAVEVGIWTCSRKGGYTVSTGDKRGGCKATCMNDDAVLLWTATKFALLCRFVLAEEPPTDSCYYAGQQ